MSSISRSNLISVRSSLFQSDYALQQSRNPNKSLSNSNSKQKLDTINDLSRYDRRAMRNYSINNISIIRLPALKLFVLKPKVEPLADQIEVVNEKVLTHIRSKTEI